MKYCLLLMFSFSAIAADLSYCNKEKTESLWVEYYNCDQAKVQVGYELINNSIVVVEQNKVTQNYQEKDNQVNFEFVKNLRELHDSNK